MWVRTEDGRLVGVAPGGVVRWLPVAPAAPNRGPWDVVYEGPSGRQVVLAMCDTPGRREDVLAAIADGLQYGSTLVDLSDLETSDLETEGGPGLPPVDSDADE